MATLYVEGVPDDLYEALRAQAKRNHRSITAEAIHLLQENVVTQAELKRRQKWLNQVAAIRRKVRWAPGPPVETLIREDRER